MTSGHSSPATSRRDSGAASLARLLPFVEPLAEDQCQSFDRSMAAELAQFEQRFAKRDSRRAPDGAPRA